jgi:hypothetical protein
MVGSSFSERHTSLSSPHREQVVSVFCAMGMADVLTVPSFQVLV